MAVPTGPGFEPTRRLQTKFPGPCPVPHGRLRRPSVAFSTEIESLRAIARQTARVPRIYLFVKAVVGNFILFVAASIAGVGYDDYASAGRSSTPLKPAASPRCACHHHSYPERKRMGGQGSACRCAQPNTGLRPGTSQSAAASSTLGKLEALYRPGARLVDVPNFSTVNVQLRSPAASVFRRAPTVAAARGNSGLASTRKTAHLSTS